MIANGAPEPERGDPVERGAGDRTAWSGYADAWRGYVAAGWWPLPLPAGKKHPPPKGSTGAAAPHASTDQMAAWAALNPLGNVALRLPPGVLGIDVDGYAGKQGGRTLAALEQRLGMLPSTWWSSSRLDGVSGIRLYRVPTEVRWKGSVAAPQGDGTTTADIDLIHAGNRYALVAPSVHPNGGRYRWLSPGCGDGAPPNVLDLPLLPQAWVDALRLSDESSARQPRGASGPTACPLPPDLTQPCGGTRRLLGGARAALSDTRHAAVVSGCLRLLRAAHVGHLGVPAALRTLQEEFLAAADDRTAAEASAEWDRVYSSAYREVGSPFQNRKMCDCTRAAYNLVLSQTEGFSKGVGGNSERELLRQMLIWSKANWYVRCSERQLAEALRKPQPSVHRIISRLKKLGWIHAVGDRSLGEGQQYRLLRHLVLTKAISAEGTAVRAGSSADISLVTTPSLLYARTGLGPGPAETLSFLPDMGLRVNARLVGLRVSSAASDVGSGKAVGRRYLDFKPGGGLSVADVAAQSGRSKQTVRRHLETLRKHHLSLRDSHGTWWRLTFDPEQVAAELAVADRQPHLKRLHERDRRTYYGYLAGHAGDASEPEVQVLDAGGLWLAVATATGEVLSTAQTPDHVAELLHARPVQECQQWDGPERRRTPVAPRRSRKGSNGGVIKPPACVIERGRQRRG